MRCKLLVGGVDKAYMDKLVSYLLVSSKHSFEITYRDNETKQAIDLSPDDFHLVVFDEPFYESYMDKLMDINMEKLLILTEALAKDLGDGHRIFKYQKADVLESYIYRYFVKMTDLEQVDRQGNDTTVIGCFSPVGGSGNTTVSQVIAKVKNGLGKKVLHVSLDIFPSFHLGYSAIQYHNLSDYIVYMMTKTNWLMGLNKMIAEDERSGIHYFNPHIHMRDLIDFDNDLLEDWVRHIKEYGDYDYIVIDFDSHNMARMLEVLSSCHKKVYTIRHDFVGDNKWASFKRDITKSGKKHLLDNACIISNKLMVKPMKVTYDYDFMMDYDNDLMVMTNKQQRINHSSHTYKKMEAYISDL